MSSGGNLEGLGSSSVVNLQYAHDTLLFGKANVGWAIVLKWILCRFEMWSGLKINFHKSACILIGQISCQTNLIPLIFNCQMEVFPTKFLGLPLREGALKGGD